MSLQVWLPLNGNLDNYGIDQSKTMTRTNGTLVTAKTGQGYQFTGNGYIEGQYYAKQTMTFALWVKFDQLTNGHLFDARSSNGSVGYQPMYFNTSSGIQVGGTNAGGVSSGFPYIPCTLTNNTWYHLAVVYSAANTKLYVNGQLKGTSTTSKGVPYNQYIQFNVDCRCSHANFLKNTICDIRIYDHSLSAEEVYHLAQALVLHYPLTSNTQITDISGYKRHGTPIDATLTTTNTLQRYDASLKFNGSSSGILIQNQGIANFWKDTCTFSFWVKSKSENGGRIVYIGNYQSNIFNINLEKNTGNQFRFYWNGNPDQSSANQLLLDGTWNHIVFVKASNELAYFYLNNVLKTTFTKTLPDFNNILDTWRIGRDTRTGTTCYNGEMTDFRIYATALDATAIEELYRMGATV